jgi:hypothetical protein
MGNSGSSGGDAGGSDRGTDQGRINDCYAKGHSAAEPWATSDPDDRDYLGDALNAAVCGNNSDTKAAYEQGWKDGNASNLCIPK